MIKHSLFSMARRSNQVLGSLRRCEYHSYGKSSEFTSTIKTASSKMAEETQTKPTLSYVIPTALAGVLGGLVYCLYNNDMKRSTPIGQGKRQGGVAPAGAAIGGPFSLVNTENQVFTDQDFGGKWVLLYFGYTSSPETVPTEVLKMAKIIDTLESKHKIKILPVFVSIDPKRDTAPQLKAYLSEFDPRIVGVTGANGAVRHMAQQYRVFYRKVDEDGDDYLVEFSHNLYLINPEKEIVRTFRVQSTAEERSEEILREIHRKSEEDV